MRRYFVFKICFSPAKKSRVSHVMWPNIETQKFEISFFSLKTLVEMGRSQNSWKIFACLLLELLT